MPSLAHSSPVCRPSCSLQYLRKTQIRCLSISQPHQAQAAAAAAGTMMKNMPKQQSMATRMKKLRRSEIPNDVGLIPQSYIRPCGNMPSWFSSPVLRMRLEWLYTKQSFLDLTRAIYQNRWNQGKDHITGRRKKLPLGLRDRQIIARDLHKQLYTALAAGDRTAISKIACSGLANQQISRIDRTRQSGAPNETWTVKYRGAILPSKLYWTIQSIIPSYFKAIHIVADRESKLPVGPGLNLRQIVLRVDSRQTLDKKDGSQPVTKKMREYLVIQKMNIEGQEDEEDGWKVWGTADPTTIEEAQEIMDMSKSESGGLLERVRAQMSGLMNTGR